MSPGIINGVVGEEVCHEHSEEGGRKLEEAKRRLEVALKAEPERTSVRAYEFGRDCQGIAGLSETAVKEIGWEIVSQFGRPYSRETAATAILRGLQERRPPAPDLAKGNNNAKLRMADTASNQKEGPPTGQNGSTIKGNPPDFTDRESAAGKGGASESSSETPATNADQREEWRKLAGDLLTDPDILERFGRAIEADGLVGETRNAKIIYLLTTTRFFDRPGSTVVKGPSSSGKSVQVEKTLRYFPPDAFVIVTAMSDRNLVFSDEDYRHRMLVIYEAAGIAGEMFVYMMRTLLSEGRIVYEFVEKTSDGLKSRRIEKEGPTGLITTTTAAALHAENETRLLSLSSVDSPEQTTGVMVAIAEEDDKPKTDVGPWHALQSYLATGETRVVVPYGKVLARKIPPAAVRLRRDFKTLLNLIRAHALLHQENRDRDPQGRIVASLADYDAIRELVSSVFAEGIKAAVSTTERETVEAVVKLIAAKGAAGRPEEVSQGALVKELGLDKGAVSHRVRKAVTDGYLRNLETKSRQPARLVIGDPMPGEVEILPRPSRDWLAETDCWTVEVIARGIKPGDSAVEELLREDLNGDQGNGEVRRVSPPKQPQQFNSRGNESTGKPIRESGDLRDDVDRGEPESADTEVTGDDDELPKATPGAAFENGGGWADAGDLDQWPEEPEEDLRPC
jgi:hypothetical protein